MKAKLKTLGLVIIPMVMILSAYLLYLNTNVDRFETNRNTESKPNYIEPEEVIQEVMYKGKTVDEIAELLNKSLSSTITDKGYLIASYSIEKGVDPYLATAIILHETGCKWGCSYLVRECNNVGGQKGSGCGSYSYFNSLDEGIMAFVDNLSRNYISYGLNTPEEINPKYAEDPEWAKKVNRYIENIKAQ